MASAVSRVNEVLTGQAVLFPQKKVSGTLWWELFEKANTFWRKGLLKTVTKNGYAAISFL